MATTVAPQSAKCRAASRPSPEAAPVTITTPDSLATLPRRSADEQLPALWRGHGTTASRFSRFWASVPMPRYGRYHRLARRPGAAHLSGVRLGSSYGLG